MTERIYNKHVKFIVELKVGCKGAKNKQQKSKNYSILSNKIIYSAFPQEAKSFESAESSSPSTSLSELPRPCLRRLPKYSCSSGGRVPQTEPSRMSHIREEFLLEGGNRGKNGSVQFEDGVKITSSRLEERDEERQGITEFFIHLV